jgi:glutaredoxin 3
MPPKCKNTKKPSKKQQLPADDAASDEEEAEVDWLHHPAREILKLAFFSGEIPLDWNRQPKSIYDKFKDRQEFKGMPYDDTFKRRLSSLRDQVKKKKDAIDIDQRAYDIFRKNFPVRAFNDVGVRRWHGSAAEFYLKADMKAGMHEGKQPSELRATRIEFQLFSKDTFRKHINQEKKLKKLENFLEDKKEKDAAKVKAKNKKKTKVNVKAMKKAMAKAEAKWKGQGQSDSDSSSEQSEGELLAMPPKSKNRKKPSVHTVVEVMDLSHYPGSNLGERVESFLHQHAVAVIATSHCPFCRDVLDVLAKQLGVTVHVINVDKINKGGEIQRHVADTYKHKTVPAVFCRGSFLGGCNDVKALRANGKLEREILAGLIGGVDELATSSSSSSSS